MTDNKKSIDYFFVIALFFFGLYYYCFRVLGFDLSRTPGDFGDSRFINYILEHGFRWLKGEDPDFWRAGFMYPLKDNIAISDSMAGALPLYALFRFLRFDTETAYQLWWLSTCILNFWCCFIAFKKIGFRLFFCAVGAYVFAFGINNFNQFYHLQFNVKFFIPLAIAALYLFLNRARIKYMLIFILCFVFQFYASAYLGILLFYFSAVFALLYLLSRPNRKRFAQGLTKKTVLLSGVASVAGVLLLLIIALPYYKMAETIGYRNYENETLPYLPRIYSYFLVNFSSVTWEGLKDSPLKYQDPFWYLQDMFPGALCYLGLIVAPVYFIIKAVKKQKPGYLPVVLFIVSFLFICLFSKTESNFSLFFYIKTLPGFESMRLTSRFLIIDVFFLLWLGLFFLEKLRIPQLALCMLLSLVVIGDNLFVADQSLLSMSLKKDREARVETMCQNIIAHNPEHRKIVACTNVTDEADAFMQLDVMLACQKLNLKTLNGYSSTCYGDLCGAYTDKSHVKLLKWMKTYYIDEKDVLFIRN